VTSEGAAELTATAEPTAAIDPSARLIRTLTLTIFLQWLGASAIIPMLPVYIRHLGGSDTTAGLVMAAFFAAGVLFQYPFGRLADRVGRRPVLVGGLLLYGAASISFLAPISPGAAIVLRGLQGAGAGAAAVASLAMISASVVVERRGRAFAAIYGGEIAGLAVGPLVGSVVGAHHLSVMFLAAGITSIGACVPALRLREPHRDTGGGGGRLGRLVLHRSAVGAFVAGASIGLTSGVYEICWTLLLVARGATPFEIGLSWTLFAVPFVLVAKPSGWLADHLDRRLLALAGIGSSAALCASYPFIHDVPVLVVLGATEAMSFAAALPAVQSLLTQGVAADQVGRVQGLFATGQTACTAIAAAAAGAAFSLAPWVPFVSVACIVGVALVAATLVWAAVDGRVRHPGDQADPPVTGAEPALAAATVASAAMAVVTPPAGVNRRDAIDGSPFGATDPR
jgi:MFS family permease